MKIKRLKVVERITIDVTELDCGSLFTIEEDNIADSDIFESTIFMKIDEFPSIIRMIDGSVYDMRNVAHNVDVIDVTGKFTLVESE